MSKLTDFLTERFEILLEMAKKSKLQPDTTHGPMGSDELFNLIGKTKSKALFKHPWYRKHVGDYGYSHPSVHKVTVDKHGYPTVHSSSGFTYTDHHGRKVRKMIQTQMAKEGGKVYQVHLFHNHNDERHPAPYKPTPVWEWKESLHNDEEK
jgi:hypothetical protein